MKKKCLVCCMVMLAVMIVSLVTSVTVSAVQTEELLFADSAETKLRQMIDGHKEETPSVAVVVFNDRQDICTVIYGRSDRENNITADENTVYEWGSVSKMLVWVSAMQLYEQGRLDLKADINTYLPDGFLTKRLNDKPMTMLDLMNHSAGFLSPVKDMETDDLSALMPLAEALRATEPAQAYTAGETVAYSNYGAALAGYIVERITGMSYADYVKQNIFDRLGMEHTAIRPDLSDNEWVAQQRKKTHCYFAGNHEMISLGECRRYIHLYPAGGACGTVGDMARFAKAFLCDSKNCPLFDKETTLDEMLAPSMYFSDGRTPRLCHGMMSEKVGVSTIGHGGNTEGFTSLLQFDPEAKTGFVMMTNKQADRIYSAELMDIFYGSPDFSAFQTDNFRQYDFSGRYRITGGSLETGCFKLYDFMNDKFDITQQNGTFTGNLGVTSIEQLSDKTAKMKLVTGTENLVFIRTNEQGEPVALENDTFDFIRINPVEYITGWVVLVLMITGLSVLLLMTIIHFIRLRHHKGLDSHSLKKAEIGLCLMSDAVALCIVLMLRLNMVNDLVRMILCIAVSAFAVLLLIMNIVSWVKKPKSCGTVLLVSETLCSLFIVSGLLYWHLFQFWGC